MDSCERWNVGIPALDASLRLPLMDVKPPINFTTTKRTAVATSQYELAKSLTDTFCCGQFN